MGEVQQIQEILIEADSYGLKQTVIDAVKYRTRFLYQIQIDPRTLVDLYESTFQTEFKKIK